MPGAALQYPLVDRLGLPKLALLVQRYRFIKLGLCLSLSLSLSLSLGLCLDLGLRLHLVADR